MFKKIMLKVAPYLGVAAGILAAPLAHAQITSSTLGASIDTVNTTFYDYFQILLAKYWPFVVGAGILVLVWHFGRRLLYAFR